MSRLTVNASAKELNATEVMMHEFNQRIIASPPGVCPVDLQLSLLKVCHAQSCGKCVPCRVGVGQLENLLEQVLNGEATMETLDLIEESANAIKDSADCAIGFESARLLLMGYEYFKEDYISHVMNKCCTGAFAQPIPCVEKCPARVDIPGYMALVNAEKYEDAVRLIRKDNPFPTACALICEHPCEERCRRNMLDSPVNIRGIKRFAVDMAAADTCKVPENAEKTGKKVALIGGGPASLTCAYFLQLMGHQTTVFEEKPELGGMLRYGIPSYRFPRERLDEDIKAILSTGVEVKYNTKVGKDVSYESLKRDYDAIFIGIGAQIAKNFEIEGKDAPGVYPAVDVLREVGLGNIPDYSGKKVIIVGGGNVAMDCARTAVRAKASKVSIVYRRREKDMTALPAEIRGAIEEGVELRTLQAPVSIEKNEDGSLKGLLTQPQISGVYDKAGRPKATKAKKDPVLVEADVILLAIGQDIDSDYLAEKGIPTKWKCIVAGKDCVVKDNEGVFSGGDCVTGPATVIKAIAAGKTAAANIDEYLGFRHEISTPDIVIPEPLMTNIEPSGRIHIVERDADIRKCDFEGVEINMSHEEAMQESARCLRCDKYGCGSFRGGREYKW